MMQVNATRHCCVGGNLVEVPAFAGMTFLRWDNGVAPSFSRRRESG